MSDFLGYCLNCVYSLSWSYQDSVAVKRCLDLAAVFEVASGLADEDKEGSHQLFCVFAPPLLSRAVLDERINSFFGLRSVDAAFSLAFFVIVIVAASFDAQDFAGKQVGDVLFKVSAGWVTDPDYLASCVDQQAVRYTANFEVLVSRADAVAGMVVLDARPALVLDVAHKLSLVLVDAHADDAHLRPVTLVVFEHFLVMSHRLLAGRAPGSPEVNQDHLACIMLNRASAIFFKLANVLDDTHRGANSFAAANLDLSIGYARECLQDRLLKSISLILLFFRELSLYAQRLVLLLLACVQNVDDLISAGRVLHLSRGAIVYVDLMQLSEDFSLFFTCVICPGL